MFLEIKDLLTPGEVAQMQEWGRTRRFVDGRVSNPNSPVKNNLQLDTSDPAFAESSRILAGALRRCGEFMDFVLPKQVAPPLLCKYAPSMNYGLHADSAILPLSPRPIRSDISGTIFIADPSTYEGGELSIQLGTRRLDFKGEPGSAVFYPSTTLHEVKPVASGERLVAITFIESQVSDPACRELLYQLKELSAQEGLNVSWENRTRLQYVIASLHRMWGSAS